MYSRHSHVCPAIHRAALQARVATVRKQARLQEAYTHRADSDIL